MTENKVERKSQRAQEAEEMTDTGVARSRVRKVSAQEEKDTTIFRRGEGREGMEVRY